MSNASMVLPPQGETTVPVVGGGSFPVRRIYCVGRNYISHIREMKEADERDPPFFFQKPRDSIVTDGSTIPYPPMTDDYQYEVELVIAVGKQGADLSEGEALDYVWGYGVGLDMTRRDRQRDALRKLGDYDRQRQAQLTRTLEEFLRQRGNISATAQALYVHPNTLRQRLRRIEELTGINIKGDDWLMIEIALKLIRLEEALGRQS